MEEFMELEDVDIVEDFTRIQDTKLMRKATSMFYAVSDVRLAIADTDKISISIVEYINAKLLHCREELRDVRKLLEEEQKRLS